MLVSFEFENVVYTDLMIPSSRISIKQLPLTDDGGIDWTIHLFDFLLLQMNQIQTANKIYNMTLESKFVSAVYALTSRNPAGGPVSGLLLWVTQV